MNKNDISLKQIILGWNPIFEISQNDPLACIELINEADYIILREQVNAAFQIDEIDEFDGVVEEDTEFGDVTDIMLEMIHERYPPDKYAAKSDTIMLSIKDRKAWRDDLIDALDEMVEQ